MINTDSNKDEVEVFYRRLGTVGAYSLASNQDDNYTKEMNYANLINCIINGKYSNLDKFVSAVLKSYYDRRKEDFQQEVKKYIDSRDYTISKKHELVEKFLNENVLNDRVGISETKNIPFVLSSIIVKKMEEIFGDVIYFNPKNSYWGNMTSEIENALKYAGYTRPFADINLYVSDKHHENFSDNIKFYQQTIKDAYISVIESYIKTPSTLVTKGISREDYEKSCNVIEKFLDNCERLMTRKTFEDIDVSTVRSFYNEFKAFGRKQAYDVYSPGDLYWNIEEASSKKSFGTASEEDEKVLEDFMDRLKVMNMALKVKDKNGNNYPANYFLIMPIRIASILGVLKDLKSSSNSKKDKSLISKSEELIRESFPTIYLKSWRTEFNPELFMESRYRVCVRSRDGSVIMDLLDKNVFNDFCQQAEEVIDKNNLPLTEACYMAVCDKLSRGKPVFNLNGVEGAEKYLPVKSESTTLNKNGDNGEGK